MSSISPIATKAFAKKIDALGCDYLDAAGLGGEVGAKNATLSIMGRRTATRRSRRSGAVREDGQEHHVDRRQRRRTDGEGRQPRSSSALNIEAVAEALVFAAKAGADPGRVRQALMGGFASSKVLEVHGERMIRRTFDPGFRIELHQKDLNLALSSARALGVALPNTATAQELFNACAAREGPGAGDHSAMVMALEQLANFEIGQSP